MNLHDIIQKNSEKEVILEEDGTPIGDFQKDRTDAMSRMFDRDKMCGQIHTTSQLYVDLDNAARKVRLSSQLSIIQAIDEWAEGMKVEENWVVLESKMQHGGMTDYCKKLADENAYFNSALSELRSFLNTKTKLQ